jgi:hypothetical protein
MMLSSKRLLSLEHGVEILAGIVYTAIFGVFLIFWLVALANLA